MADFTDNNSSDRAGTYAMLKSIWTDGDYFVPFERLLITLLSRKAIAVITDIKALSDEFQQYWRIDVPYMAMLFLLKRLADKKYLQKDDQHYRVLAHNIDKALIIPAQSVKAYEAEYDSIINDCKDNIAKQFGIQYSYEEINQGFCQILKSQAANILLGEYSCGGEESTERKYLIANYIANLAESDVEKFALLNDIAIRYMLGRCLSMNDGQVPLTLKGLHVYLDTSVVFRYLGIDLVQNRQEIYQRLIADLIESGAKVFVLQDNITEVSNILDSAGIYAPSPLYDPILASETTTYYRMKGASSADILETRNNLVGLLKRDGILVCPGHLQPELQTFNQDEKVIAEYIRKEYKKRNPYLDFDKKESSITLDAKTINLITCYREGRASQNILDCKHVFVATNVSLAFAAQQFEQEVMLVQEGCVSSCVTAEFIGLIAWLHRPTRLFEMSQRTLLSLAYAAFLPSDRVIAEFDKQLKECVKREKISEEDYYAMRSVPIVRDVLMQLCKGNVANISIDTPLEILARIKQNARDEERLTQEKIRIQNEMDALLLSKKEKLLEKNDEKSFVQEQLLASKKQIEYFEGLAATCNKEFNTIKKRRNLGWITTFSVTFLGSIICSILYKGVGNTIITIFGFLISATALFTPYLHYAITKRTMPDPKEFFKQRDIRLYGKCENRTGYSHERHGEAILNDNLLKERYDQIANSIYELEGIIRQAK